MDGIEKERWGGGTQSIPASHKREINGASPSVSVALCARRPLLKHNPHIWHESGARAADFSLFHR